MFCQSALGLLSKLDIFVQYCDFVQCSRTCFVQNYYISHSFIVIDILFREKDRICPWSNNRHKEALSVLISLYERHATGTYSPSRLRCAFPVHPCTGIAGYLQNTKSF